MSEPGFVDISAYQSLDIDWQKYKVWSAAGDGTSRVSLCSSYGTNFSDIHYAIFRKAAEAAGISIIVHYHYAYPSLNSPEAEADYQYSVVGSIRPNDVLMLDYEENVPAATADWAYRWLTRQEANYNGKLPIIYASDSYVRARLQDSRLAKYPLVLANWTFDPSARPACPPPWKSYSYLQYSDKATNIPGIPGAVDANVYLGSATGGTVSELLNFPFVNQRTDGDLNHDYDCVPSSLEAGANHLLGKPVVNDAAMKDAIYGKGYVGGTAAVAFIDYLRTRGVHIWPLSGPYSYLIPQAHAQLAAGHPVVFTRDDPYSSNPNDSHVSVWYKDTATSLTCMDPFGAIAITMSDSEWTSHLRGNEFWFMEKVMSNIPAGWQDDGQTLIASNKVAVVKGFRTHILADSNWNSGNVPLEAEYAASLVLLHNPGLGAGTRQCFRDCLLWYTTAKGVVVEPFMGLELKSAYDEIAALSSVKQPVASLPSTTPVDTSAIKADVAALLSAIGTMTNAFEPLITKLEEDAGKL